MKNPLSSNDHYQNKKNQKFSNGNNEIKTSNVNILLNRVRQENINDKKKKIILSISIISFISLVSILVFGN